MQRKVSELQTDNGILSEQKKSIEEKASERIKVIEEWKRGSRLMEEQPQNDGKAKQELFIAREQIFNLQSQLHNQQLAIERITRENEMKENENNELMDFLENLKEEKENLSNDVNLKI